MDTKNSDFLIPQWHIAKNLIVYPEALSFMEQHVYKIRAKNAQELIWLLEHPSLYTAGTSTNLNDILDSSLCPLYQTGRGGQLTYHGPGQRIAYLMLDLQKRKLDIHAYVRTLEQWIISTLSEFEIHAECRENRVGVWVIDPKMGTENKIAAIGIRIRKWVSFHGISLNVNPDLSYYRGIVPCGVREYGITSMHKLGVNVSMKEVDKALKKHFNLIFGVKGVYSK
jgi:lipoyl(octanoyl) transferase